MKFSAKKGLAIALIFVGATLLLLGASWIAIEYCAGNAALFAVALLIVPMVIVALAALVMGMQFRWTWIRGGCAALALALICGGAGGLATAHMKDAPPQGKAYEALDEQAYQYMLEQGMIEQGDEIYAGQGDGTGELRSQMYVGIQQSDPVTELVGNVVTFLIALGACFAGGKIRQKSLMQRGSGA